MLRSTTPFDKCQTAVFVFMDNGARTMEQGARSKEQRLKCVRLMWQAVIHTSLYPYSICPVARTITKLK